jgi:type VI secretion system Hcp family effector
VKGQGNVTTGNQAMAYMRAKGSAQGAFVEDHSRAGKGKTLCLSVRFRGEVPHDVRGGGRYATTRHEPVSIVHEWGPATVQFMTALWANETLDEVELEFLRPGNAGEDLSFAWITLKKATVAYVELVSGATHKLAPGEHRQLADVGLHAEQIEFKFHGHDGPHVAQYDRSKQS